MNDEITIQIKVPASLLSNLDKLLSCISIVTGNTEEGNITGNSNITSINTFNADDDVKGNITSDTSIKYPTSNNTATSNTTATSNKYPTSNIQPSIPRYDDVVAYVKEKGYTNVPIDRFFDYYTQRGWRNVSDWKLKVDYWENNGIRNTEPVKKDFTEVKTELPNTIRK